MLEYLQNWHSQRCGHAPVAVQLAGARPREATEWIMTAVDEHGLVLERPDRRGRGFAFTWPSVRSVVPLH